MWLALLAAVLDDAAVETPRRAASHELARRLGIGWRREVAAPPALTLREVVLCGIEKARTVEDAVALMMALNHLTRAFDGERTTYPHVDFGPTTDWPPDITHPRVPRQKETLCEDLAPFFLWFVRVYRHEVDAWFRLWPDKQARIRNYTTFVASMLHPMDEVLDWARAHPLREVLATPIERAREVAEGWHRTMAMARDSGAPRPGVVVARFRDGATIQRLFTRAQLDAEGKAMGHCVGTHHASVTDGHSEVFSYRDPRGLPQATWEVTARYGPYGIGVELLDLEGPNNEEVWTKDARRRVGAWLDAAGLSMGGFADKVGRTASTIPRLVPESLFGEDPIDDPPLEVFVIGARLRDRGRGLVEKARAYDAEVMAAVLNGQFVDGLAALTHLCNVLDIGILAYLRAPRRLSAGESPIAPLRIATLGFDYGGGLDEAIEGQIGRTRTNEPFVVAFVRDVDTDEPRVIGKGPSVLTALRDARLLETIADRAARVATAEARLADAGLQASLDAGTAHSPDREIVEAASAALSDRA